MKKLAILCLAVLSIGTMAKSKDFAEVVKVSDSSATVAYEKALDIVQEVKSARYRDQLPYLKDCNLRPNQYSDNFFFRRQAWTNSSSVTLNHVTGMYTAKVQVRCTIRKKKD